MTGFRGAARQRESAGRHMRTMADSTGTVWTVFEVKKTGASDQWAYLPEQFGNGWLCFESDVAKRRLTPIPPGWSELSDGDILVLMNAAQPVIRARASTGGETRAEA